MVAKDFDEHILNKVKELLDKNKFPDYDDICTDTFSELIDKLIIVHIRYWYLEDAMASAKNDEELLHYRKKSESLFKEKRPMLVKGLDKIITNMITGKYKATGENTKMYKGWDYK